MDYAQLTYFSLVGRIDQFLIGMLAAFAFPHVRRYLGRPWVVGVAMAVVVSALWVFNQVHGNAEPTLLRTVWVDIEGLAWAAVVLGYVSTARFGRGRLSTALAWTGERSYGMYLLHMPLVHLVVIQHWRLDTPGGPVLDAMLSALVLVLPGAVLLATLSYSAVEQPFLSLRRRYVSLEPAPAPVDTTMAKAAPVEPATERLRLPVARIGA
jgi:peptidoglycan/LPS O-acetylase OafA/YrhL